MPKIAQTLSTLSFETSRQMAPALKPESVNRLFKELIAMLGPVKVGQMCGTGDGDDRVMREVWAEHLGGFLQGEIKRGLREVATRRFPPTLGEFAVWCRPCLDPEAAWIEAEYCLLQRDNGLMGDWTHPAVYRAACVMRAEVRSGDFQRHRARWSAAMKRELAAGWGEAIPPPPQTIGYTPAPAGPVTAEALELKARIRKEMAEKEAAAKKVAVEAAARAAAQAEEQAP